MGAGGEKPPATRLEISIISRTSRYHKQITPSTSISTRQAAPEARIQPKIGFLISQHVSRRSVQPGAFFAAQSTLFQSCFIMVVQFKLDAPIISGTPCSSWVKVTNSKKSGPSASIRMYEGGYLGAFIIAPALALQVNFFRSRLMILHIKQLEEVMFRSIRHHCCS